MKTLKSLFLVFLALSLCLCLIACGGKDDECKNHADTNGDGVCEECGKEVKNENDDGGNDGGENDGATLELIKDGVAKFQFVTENGLDSLVRMEVKNLQLALSEMDIDVDIVNDKENTVKDIEVLVGDITTRGDKYNYNRRKLGPKGSAITLVDNKLIIAGGNENSFLDAWEVFVEDILGIDKDTESLTNVTATTEHLYEDVQTKFTFDGVTIADLDARDFKIYIDTSDKEIKSAAADVQLFLYEKAGYWIPIETYKKTEIPEKSIFITLKENTRKGNGFDAYVSGSTLVITTEFANKARAEINKIFDSFLLESSLSIGKKYTYTKDVRSLYYTDYCQENNIALDTNGRKNAYEGIKATHDYANTYGHTVRANAGEKYLIEGIDGQPIAISTDVDWGGAEFIIDDRNFKVEWTGDKDSRLWLPELDARMAVMQIVSDYGVKSLSATDPLFEKINSAGGINTTTTENNTTFFGMKPSDFGKNYKTVMLFPKNADHKVYIRYGGNANSGSAQEELIILNEDGTIDEKTPFLLDYEKVTSLRYICVDDEPITVSGATFTTRANKAPCSYSAGFTRNIQISRSNTTLFNIKHKITDEGDTGSCYSGFFQINNSNNVTLDTCEVQAHRMYYDEVLNSKGELISYGTSMGTYELSGSMANNLYYKNCTQSNFNSTIADGGNDQDIWYKDGDVASGITGTNNYGTRASLWGVMGTNYCKNMTYDNCKLNRLDAHAGVINASIINGSEVINIRLVGGGTALIEDSTVHNRGTMISLREDYGSTWNGDVIIRNVTFVNNSTSVTLIGGTYYNHYFGYTTYMPVNVIIDGLKIHGSGGRFVYVYGDFGAGDNDITADTYPTKPYGSSEEPTDQPNVNKMVLTKTITVKNPDPGHVYYPAADGSFFASKLTITYSNDEE